MLRVVDVSVEVGGRLTLVGASFTVQPGDKVGLVGRNGAGKTSMLRVLAGEGDPVEGRITRTGAVGYLNQDPAAQPTWSTRPPSTTCSAAASSTRS